MKKATLAFASLALGLALITGCTNEKDANPGEMPWCDHCQKYSECADACADNMKGANPGVVDGATKGHCDGTGAKGDCCDEGAKADCGSACPEGKTGECPEAAKSASPGVVEGASGHCDGTGAKADCGSACPEGKTGECPGRDCQAVPQRLIQAAAHSDL
ncbi:MAG: hypothetical protein HND57_10715 [Planctomycetes bacterium]|nr:hypothetical protein [Planctomycetota bacterium]